MYSHLLYFVVLVVVLVVLPLVVQCTVCSVPCVVHGTALHCTAAAANKTIKTYLYNYYGDVRGCVHALCLCPLPLAVSIQALMAWLAGTLAGN